ncbi:MAG: hypothetical protein QUV06_00525 [Cyanobium sp. CZS 48M]|nr:hypothetical protein [Cyanobium sp. CZS48M]
MGVIRRVHQIARPGDAVLASSGAQTFQVAMGPVIKHSPRAALARWPTWWLCGLAVAAAALVDVAPARSGSVSADSVWTRENALERARQLVPRGAIPGRHRCQEMMVGTGNYRYRCIVEFSRPADQRPDQQPDQPSP